MADNNQTQQTAAQQTQAQTPPAAQNSTAQQQTAAIDYEKLIEIVNGKQSAAEKTVLKSYFEQQGLSKEEAETAMAEFKKAKEAKQPNVAEMQKSLETAQSAQLKTAIENKALLLHKELGVEFSTVPYLVKMADMSKVIVDGKISDETLKEALNKVIEDVPALKVQQTAQVQGFVQIGAGKNNAQQGQTQAKPVATKRWNRFNN
ncbi:MAG: hypothetical protein IKB62_04300 [Oscillospiraceae bacterium]|nr:hypothetical protein [Oscillospiraceae bacterium]